jgi:hypothetical protein
MMMIPICSNKSSGGGKKLMRKTLKQKLEDKLWPKSSFWEGIAFASAIKFINLLIFISPKLTLLLFNSLTYLVVSNFICMSW